MITGFSMPEVEPEIEKVVELFDRIGNIIKNRYGPTAKQLQFFLALSANRTSGIT